MRLGVDVDEIDRVPVVANLLFQARQHRHHPEHMAPLADLLAS